MATGADDEVKAWDASPEAPQVLGAEEHDLLPILAVTSKNYEHVFAFWESSLDLLNYPREKRHVADLGELQPPFGYCTVSWRSAIDQQLLEVTNWIRDHPGEYFLHTDTDIQFFPRFLETQGEWLRWMKEERLDMIFMRERTQVMPEMRVGEMNAGFYIVHCNDRTLRFWEKVLSDELAFPKMDGYPPYTDQYHVNRGLNHRRGAFPQEGAFGVRWATIPDYHCIWCAPECEEEIVLAAFHHAVNTQDKPQLLASVRGTVLAVQSCRGASQGPHELGVETYHERRIRELSRAVAAIHESQPNSISGSGSNVAAQHLLREAEALEGELRACDDRNRFVSCASCARRPAEWRDLVWSCE
ncbi:unnamed protein product, partial [Polarella glacialis]